MTTTRELRDADHYVKTNVSWMGSGRDDDPWIMVAWDVEACDCDAIWRHRDLA